ncbi:MAG: hypothetical protein ABSD92_00950 [Candidatus Bathyarchaeia archaeon]|jgi:hypothetical protein
MKNKPIVASNYPNKKNTPKYPSKKEGPGFEQLITDAGCPKKAADELLKWYTNSK